MKRSLRLLHLLCLFIFVDSLLILSSSSSSSSFVLAANDVLWPSTTPAPVDGVVTIGSGIFDNFIIEQNAPNQTHLVVSGNIGRISAAVGSPVIPLMDSIVEFRDCIIGNVTFPRQENTRFSTGETLMLLGVSEIRFVRCTVHGHMRLWTWMQSPDARVLIDSVSFILENDNYDDKQHSRYTRLWISLLRHEDAPAVFDTINISHCVFVMSHLRRALSINTDCPACRGVWAGDPVLSPIVGGSIVFDHNTFLYHGVDQQGLVNRERPPAGYDDVSIVYVFFTRDRNESNCPILTLQELVYRRNNISALFDFSRKLDWLDDNKTINSFYGFSFQFETLPHVGEIGGVDNEHFVNVVNISDNSFSLRGVGIALGSAKHLMNARVPPAMEHGLFNCARKGGNMRIGSGVFVERNEAYAENSGIVFNDLDIRVACQVPLVLVADNVAVIRYTAVGAGPTVKSSGIKYDFPPERLANRFVESIVFVNNYVEMFAVDKARALGVSYDNPGYIINLGKPGLTLLNNSVALTNVTQGTSCFNLNHEIGTARGGSTILVEGCSCVINGWADSPANDVEARDPMTEFAVSALIVNGAAYDQNPAAVIIRNNVFSFVVTSGDVLGVFVSPAIAIGDDGPEYHTVFTIYDNTMSITRSSNLRMNSYSMGIGFIWHREYNASLTWVVNISRNNISVRSSCPCPILCCGGAGFFFGLQDYLDLRKGVGPISVTSNNFSISGEGGSSAGVVIGLVRARPNPALVPSDGQVRMPAPSDISFWFSITTQITFLHIQVSDNNMDLYNSGNAAGVAIFLAGHATVHQLDITRNTFNINSLTDHSDRASLFWCGCPAGKYMLHVEVVISGGTPENPNIFSGDFPATLMCVSDPVFPKLKYSRIVAGGISIVNNVLNGGSNVVHFQDALEVTGQLLLENNTAMSLLAKRDIHQMASIIRIDLPVLGAPRPPPFSAGPIRRIATITISNNSLRLLSQCIPSHFRDSEKAERDTGLGPEMWRGLVFGLVFAVDVEVGLVEVTNSSRLEVQCGPVHVVTANPPTDKKQMEAMQITMPLIFAERVGSVRVDRDVRVRVSELLLGGGQQQTLLVLPSRLSVALVAFAGISSSSSSSPLSANFSNMRVDSLWPDGDSAFLYTPKKPPSSPAKRQEALDQMPVVPFTSFNCVRWNGDDEMVVESSSVVKSCISTPFLRRPSPGGGSSTARRLFRGCDGWVASRTATRTGTDTNSSLLLTETRTLEQSSTRSVVTEFKVPIYRPPASAVSVINVVGALLSSSSSIKHAFRASALARMRQCSTRNGTTSLDENPLEWDSNPLAMRLGSQAVLETYVGALVGNVVFCIVTLILIGAAVLYHFRRLLLKAKTSSSTAVDQEQILERAKEHVRWPSIAQPVCMMVLGLPCCMALAAVLSYPARHDYSIFVSIPSLVLFVVVPVVAQAWMLVYIREHSDEERCIPVVQPQQEVAKPTRSRDSHRRHRRRRHEEEEQRQQQQQQQQHAEKPPLLSRIWSYLLDPYAWSHQETPFFKKWGIHYESFHWYGFSVFDWAIAAGSGIVAGVSLNCQGTRCCIGVSVASLLLCVGHTMVLALKRPFITRAERIVADLMSVTVLTQTALEIAELVLRRDGYELKQLELAEHNNRLSAFSLSLCFISLFFTLLPILQPAVEKLLEKCRKSKESGEQQQQQQERATSRFNLQRVSGDDDDDDSEMQLLSRGGRDRHRSGSAQAVRLSEMLLKPLPSASSSRSSLALRGATNRSSSTLSLRNDENRNSASYRERGRSRHREDETVDQPRQQPQRQQKNRSGVMEVVQRAHQRYQML